jgi:hypothetical protein
MSHFGPWEVLAYGALWIGGFMLAVDVGLRMAPNIRVKFPALEKIQESGIWGFTPLILLTLAGGIFLAEAAGWISARNPAAPPPEAAVPPEAHPILSSNIWSYLPLALLTLVGIIWLIRQFPIARTVKAPASQNAIPTRTVVQLAPLIEMEIGLARLGHAAPWVEFYCDGFNATGYSMRLISAKGRIKCGAEEFHAQIELGEKNWAYPADDLYSFSLRIPLSKSEAAYFSKISSQGHFPVSFLDACIEATADGPLASSPFQIRLPGRTGTIYFDAATRRPDPSLARQQNPHPERS